MRILSICRTLPTPDRPGAGVFVFRRLAAMALSADIRVLQPIPFLPGLRPLPHWARTAEHTVEGISIRHQPMLYIPGMLKSLDGWWLARCVLPSLRAWHGANPFDLVDAHFGYPDGVGCVLAAKRLGLPVFVTIRGLEADRVRKPLLRRQLVAALNAATGCISVSHTLRELMIAHGVSSDKIVVIPNAVDRGTFRPGSQAAARKALGLPPEGDLVVSVGHLISRKRHDMMIRALARMGERPAPLSLVIVGGPDHEPECPGQLRRLAQELGVADRVLFVGAVPPAQIAEWLRASDLFALATAHEGCCNAILEALATGTPVVTTPVGDNQHFVRDGINGHLVPVDKPDAIARAIARTLGQAWDREQISAGLPVGTWGDAARAVIEFYKDRIAVANRLAA